MGRRWKSAVARVALLLAALCSSPAAQAQTWQWVGGSNFGKLPVVSETGQVIYGSGTNLVLGTPEAPAQKALFSASGPAFYMWGPGGNALFQVSSNNLWPLYVLQGTTLSLVTGDAYGFAWGEGGRLVTRDSQGRLYSGTIGGVTLLTNSFSANRLFVSPANVLYAGLGDRLVKHDDVNGWQEVAYSAYSGRTNFVSALPGYFLVEWPQPQGSSADGAIYYYTGLQSTNGNAPRLKGYFKGTGTSDIRPVILQDFSSATNGTPIPDRPGLYFYNLQRMLVAPDGTCVFDVNAVNATWSQTNIGIYACTGTNDLRRIASNLNLPGLGVSNKVTTIGSMALVSSNQFVFNASVTYWNAQGGQANSQGLWLADFSGNVRLLAKSGDTFIEPGRTNVFGMNGGIQMVSVDYAASQGSGGKLGLDGNPSPSRGGGYVVLLDNTNTLRINLAGPANRPPLIATQPPVTTNLNAGAVAELVCAVDATAPYSLQWYRVGTSTVPVSGANNSNLVFNPVQIGDDAGYFLVVSNSYGAVTSATSFVSVNYAPIITAQPQSQVVVTNNTLSLSVTAQGRFNGSSSLTYQWQREGTNLAGATFSTYAKGGFTPADAGNYRVIVSNAMGAVTSAVAVITSTNGYLPVFVQTPPAQVTVARGAQLVLSCTVTGTTAITYRWYRNGAAITGTAGAGTTYTGNNIQTNASGPYFLTASNRLGVATSAVVNVTVLIGTNAAFAGVPFVKVIGKDTLVPDPNSTAAFTNVNSIRLRNGQVLIGATYAAGPSRTNATAAFLFNSQGLRKVVDSAAPISGATGWLGSLALAQPGDGAYLARGNLATNQADAANGIFANQTIFRFQAGSGSAITEQLAMEPPNFPGGRFSIAGQPEFIGGQGAFLSYYGTTNAGYPGVFAWNAASGLVALTATNTLLPGYGQPFGVSSTQIGFDGTNIAFWGGYNLDQPPQPYRYLDGIYRVPVSGGALERVADRTSLIPQVGTPFLAFLTPPTVFGDRTYFQGYADDFLSHPANGPAYVVYGDGTGLHKAAYTGDAAPERPVSATIKSLSLGHARPGGVYLQCSYSDNGTGVAFWQDGGLQKVIDNLNLVDNRAIQSVTYVDSDGPAVLVRVDFVNNDWAYYANIATLPPMISGQPANQTVAEGGSASFSVTAYGPAPLTYQWYKGASPIAEGTNSSLLLNSVSLADNGTTYQVVIGNANGSVTSTVATLTVGAYPTIFSQPGDTVALAGSNVTWSISLSNYTAVQWYSVNPTNGGITYLGSGTNITLTNVQAANAGPYYVYAGNNIAATNLPRFNLVVVTNAAQLTGPPIITTQPVGRTNALGSSVTLAVRAYSGNGALRYQWLKEGSVLSSATGSELLLPSLQVGDAANYSVIVSNDAGAITSLVANVAVLYAPVFVQDLADAQIALDQPLVMSVTVTGTPPITCQLFRNGALAQSVAGPGLVSFNLGNANQAQAGGYFVRAVGAGGTVTGRVATVTIASNRLALPAERPTTGGIALNGFRVLGTVTTNQPFLLQVSGNLTNWTTLTNFTSADGQLDYVDREALTNRQRFYRLRSP